MPRKNVKNKTLGHYVQSWKSQINLIKRALFSTPRRIIGKDYSTGTLLERIKKIISHISPSLWILVGSVIILLYAVVGFQNKSSSSQQILVHNVADESTGTTPISGDSISILTDSLLDLSWSSLAPEETSTPNQLVYDLYAAINTNSYTVTDFFDSYMASSNLIKNYFTPAKIQKIIEATVEGIQVSDMESFDTNRSDRIGVRYTISYTLEETQEAFTQVRSVTLREQNGWKIGTIQCESRWCATSPIFNPQKYAIE